ncbi:MAG: CHAT domain-containing protein [Desulfobulbaceae bacterium]|nr:CHAT domain-containing protein [Desulfobulbaceae bacterium]
MKNIRKYKRGEKWGKEKNITWSPKKNCSKSNLTPRLSSTLAGHADTQYALLECRRNIEFADAVVGKETITEGEGGRTRAHICSDLNALIAGDPFPGSNSLFPELSGAQKEALGVAQVLEHSGVKVKGENLLIRKTGAEILSRMMTEKFGILHLAGHGVVDYEFPESAHNRKGTGSGLSLLPNTWLHCKISVKMQKSPPDRNSSLSGTHLRLLPGTCLKSTKKKSAVRAALKKTGRKLGLK